MPILHWKFRSLNLQNAMKKSKINFSKWLVYSQFSGVLYLKEHIKSYLFLLIAKFPKLNVLTYYINISCFSAMILRVYHIQQLIRIQLPNTKEYVTLAKKGIRMLYKFAFLKSRRDVSLDKDPETYHFRFLFMI